MDRDNDPRRHGKEHRQIEELRRRLEEAEQTIDAIRSGEVDAVVTSGDEGHRIYTLEGPDHPYRNIVETMNAGAITINRKGTIFYSNTAFSTMTGLPLQTIIGSRFHDLVIPEDLPLFLAFLENTRKVGKTTEKISIKSQRGRIFVRLAGSSQIVDDIERITLVIADISDLKSAQDSLRREAQAAQSQRYQLSTLIDSINEGVWFLHDDGRILLANAVAKAQATQVGIDPGTVLHSSFSSLLAQVDILSADGKSFSLDPFLAVFQGKPINRMELAIRNKSTGEIFFRRLAANPILSREKRLEGVIAVIQDITGEKSAEKEKARLEDHLRQAQKMEAIGTLAGGIAHDFNNMLAVILGNAELALDDIDDDNETRRNIEQIVKASKRARDLVKQILTFSRKGDAGRKTLKLTPLIKETLSMLRGTLPSTIEIKFEISTESDTVISDPSQMQQVLMNLATNAAYAMREKGGILSIALTNVTVRRGHHLPDPDMSPGSYVKMTISDTGKGMTEQVRDRIFEPFFTTKPGGQGTGMGLAVVYGIIKGHAGAITVDSEPRKGSVFTIFLPRAKDEAQREAKQADRLQGGKEQILLVDDEPLVVEMTARTLERLGYTVKKAKGGAEALKIFLEDPQGFDLVMTDQTMPGITGTDLAERVLRTRKDVPIILFTGYSETVSPEKAKASGIREFIMKPIEKGEVAQTIRRVLDDRRGPGP